MLIILILRFSCMEVLQNRYLSILQVLDGWPLVWSKIIETNTSLEYWIIKICNAYFILVQKQCILVTYTRLSRYPMQEATTQSQ